MSIVWLCVGSLTGISSMFTPLGRTKKVPLDFPISLSFDSSLLWNNGSVLLNSYTEDML